jgi:hypothetical protein
MSNWSNKTLNAITVLASSVDGAYSAVVKHNPGQTPSGTKQDYEGPAVNGVKHEWVDQGGGGITGDDFHGFVTFVLGEYHLVVSF